MPASRLSIGLVAFLMAPWSVGAVEVISGPTLTMNPTGNTPLAGVVELETDVPVRIRMLISEGGETQTVDFPDLAQQHYLPVLGLKPDRTYSVEVRAVPGGPLGTVLATTGPLPDDFPTLVTHVSIPGLMEPGYTLLDCFGRSSDPRPSYGIAVDSAGEVVWYSTRCFIAVRQMPNGDLVWRTNQVAHRMDMLGNDVTMTLQVPGLGLHHEFEPTPNGTYLSLTQRSVEVPDYPSSYTDPNAPPQLATVLDEPVVEFLPDGTVRHEWSMLEMLDPHRIGYDSLRESPTGMDWIHANAAIYDPADDSIVVSGRHQDALIKFSRATGELIWILGNPANWSPEFQPYLLQPVGSPFRWQYHQHAPMWSDQGTLVVFDNGNRRASPFDGMTPIVDADNFSRGVEFEIDEDLMQVRQLWQYGEGATPRLNSFFLSDADAQPITGNRLMVFGGVNYVDGVASADLGMGPAHTRVVETTGGVNPQVVFDMSMFDPSGGQVTTFRGERIPSLYPPQYVKPPNGVGRTVRMDRPSGSSVLTWTVSPVDEGHDAADYYIEYVSASPSSGFAMFESTANTECGSSDREDPLLFFKVVAANSEGTSGDEPTP